METWGRLDVLMNNVGTPRVPGDGTTVDLVAWERGFRINVTSMVMMVPAHSGRQLGGVDAGWLSPGKDQRGRIENGRHGLGRRIWRTLSGQRRITLDHRRGSADQCRGHRHHPALQYVQPVLAITGPAGQLGSALAGAGGLISVTPDQIEFIELIISELATNGVMEAGRLYESPFLDISPQGPEGLFPVAKVDRMVLLLDEIRHRAAA